MSKPQLSDEQRAALAWLPADGSWMAWVPNYDTSAPSRKALASLQRMKPALVIFDGGQVMCRLSKAGQRTITDSKENNES